MKIKLSYILAGLAFVSGMVLMVFELVAARLLAPTIGSSTYIWTSVIGVIIAMLAVGVWLGGRLADKRNSFEDVALLLLATAFAVSLVINFSSIILELLSHSDIGPRLKGVLASLLLFAPTSFLLGTVGPYLAKLNVRALSHTGRSIANIDAMNAVGGIFGTFLTGFVLFSFVGSKKILVLLVVLLVVVSWAVRPRQNAEVRVVLSLAILTMAFMLPDLTRDIHIDTATAHYVISEQKTGKVSVRFISTGPSGVQSGVDQSNPDDLLFWYTKEIANVVDGLTQKDRILVLGGGAYTLPRYLADEYPGSQIDVVEIDPELTMIAQKYFYYGDRGNLKNISDDARSYIDATDQQYDLVIVDIYNDTEVPFTVLTEQYGRSVRRLTRPGGVVIANIIAGENNSQCGRFLAASLKPYMDNFAFGAYRSRDEALSRANTIAVFGETSLKLGEDYKEALIADTPIYTDDFSPAEALQFGCASST